MITKNTIIIIILVLCYLLFSTTVMNNRFGCEFKHILYTTMLDYELNQEKYKVFNPSITKTDEGYIICFRYSNSISKNIYLWLTSKLNSNSHIAIAKLSPSFKIKNLKILDIKGPPLEDPRIEYYNGKYYISITEFKKIRYIFPCLYVLDNNFNVLQRIEYNKLDYFGEKLVYKSKFIEKNWCPFTRGKDLLLHTDTFPVWKVFSLGNTGSMNQITSFDSRKFFKFVRQPHIRCSTSWKSFTKKTYICGIHTKQYSGVFSTIRTILVEIDKITLLPIRSTDVFCIDNNDSRIQFLSGLETDDIFVYLAFGIGDYKTKIIRLSKKYVSNLLDFKTT